MNEQYKNEEERRYSGLTTAALARSGEQTALGINPELRDPEPRDPGRRPPETGDPVVETGAAAAAAPEQTAPLLSAGEAKELRARWDAVQGAFVDEPRRAVEQADGLVADAMKRMAEIFADERAKLEGQWDRDEGVSTEDLRLALRRYRSFFGRVLSV